MPIAEIDGQIQPVRGEIVCQRGNQGAVLGVDGTHAAKQAVMRGDGFQSRRRHTVAHNPFQKGNDLILPFRTAEGKEEQGVGR